MLCSPPGAEAQASRERRRDDRKPRIDANTATTAAATPGSADAAPAAAATSTAAAASPAGLAAIGTDDGSEQPHAAAASCLAASQPHEFKQVGSLACLAAPQVWVIGLRPVGATETQRTRRRENLA